jgi:hypothetical protein
LIDLSISSLVIGRRAAILFCGAAALPRRSLAAGGSVMIDFSSMPVGQPPTGFSTAMTGRGSPSAWSIQEDATVPGGKVLIQTSMDQTDYRFPLAIYDGFAATNVEATVHFKAIAGRIDRAGGIAFRLTDADNYYVVRANALEDNVNFYSVIRGSRRQIAGVSTNVASGVWHVMGLRAEADRFEVSFNGRRLFTAKDNTFTNAGKIALWTKADSVTQFHGLEIRTLG